MATLRQVFHDIAESIRAKGVSGTFKPIDMAQKIGEIQTGGSEDYGYLTFTAEEANTLTLQQYKSTAPHKLLKSTDTVNWTKWENPATNGISLSAGESVYIKADEDTLQKTANSATEYNYFSSSGSIKCYGNIMSIVKLVTPGDYNLWFSRLFYECSSLVEAPELPTTTLPQHCYEYMFYGCSSLTSAPELSATTLADYCYAYMFYGCKSLTSAPELPATNLAYKCYTDMFNECTSLIKVQSVLPATTLTPYCYTDMFQGCTSLSSAPELPATTLANFCYQYMFGGCASLTQAPELPAKTLANQCYYCMFRDCASLTQAPELPGTTLGNLSYNYMFQGCTSLIKAPSVLPATTLNSRCYYYMFKDCSSLVEAPKLPATTLVSGCYQFMFQGCTSLKRIKMNASSKNWGTYMFDGCTSLELVDMTGSIGVPQLSNVNNFANTNNTYKIVVPDSLYDTWIAATNWASIASHIMKQSDWNAAHPDDQL